MGVSCPCGWAGPHAAHPCDTWLHMPLLQTSVEEMIASTAYLDLFLRSVSETALLKTFLRFVLLHRHDNTTILDTLVGRINSNSRVSPVAPHGPSTSSSHPKHPYPQHPHPHLYLVPNIPILILVPSHSHPLPLSCHGAGGTAAAHSAAPLTPRTVPSCAWCP